MKLNIALLSLLALLGASSCDIVDLPIEKPVVVVIDTGVAYPVIDTAALNTTVQRNLIEEYTGHKCTACPANTDTLLGLQKAHPEDLVVLAYHAGETFAKVDLPDYPTDMRTDFGEDTHDHFGIFNIGYPSLTINRATFPDFGDNTVFLSALNWSDPILSVTSTTPEVAIGLGADYIDSLEQFYIRVSGQAISALTGDYQIMLVCVEDSVIAEQKDGRLKESEYPHKINTQYVHRHVVRGKLHASESIFGDGVITGGLAAGEWFNYTTTSVMPEKVENYDHVLVVAALMDKSTGEVIQAEEVHAHIIK